MGDYLKHTAHLSPLEDIAYRRLLDVYYDTESPIPTDIPLVSRRLRIDPATVKLVLDEFFQLTEQGYRNKRADVEIVAYHAFLEKQKANGIKGGRPKGKPTDNPPLSQAEPKITLTVNQQPSNNNKENKQKKKSIPMPEGMNEQIWQDFLTIRTKGITQTGLNGIANQAGLAGISLEAALQECCIRNWQSYRADWIKPKQGVSNVKFNVHAAGREALARAVAQEVVGSRAPWEIPDVVHDQVHIQLPGPADD
jgi:uncharacterized protein YdaU (DUF1376 family)